MGYIKGENMKNKVMTKNTFLSKKTLAIEFVEIEDGAGLYMKELTGKSAEYLAERSKQAVAPSNIEAMGILIALSACDAVGELLFDVEDVASIIENNSVAILVKLSEVAVRLSGLNPNALREETAKLKNV